MRIPANRSGGMSSKNSGEDPDTMVSGVALFLFKGEQPWLPNTSHTSQQVVLTAH